MRTRSDCHVFHGESDTSGVHPDRDRDRSSDRDRGAASATFVSDRIAALLFMRREPSPVRRILPPVREKAVMKPPV